MGDTSSIFDVAVIGAGPGGYHAAVLAAQKGMKVLLVEKDKPGGTCLNRGCIPTKSYVHDINVYHSAKQSPVLTGKDQLGIDMKQVLNRKNKVVAANVGGLEAIFRSYPIEFVRGTGELKGPGRIQVTPQKGQASDYQAKNIILATGSRPAVPKFLQMDGQVVQTTDQILNLDTVPRNIVIIGGGVIGMEFAFIFGALGAGVTVIEMLPDIIPTEDEEIRKVLWQSVKKRNISVHCEARVTGIDIHGATAAVGFTDKSGQSQKIEADRVLVATGRAPVLDGVNPQQNGLAMNGPFLKVNSRMETSMAGVYAIGDLVGGMMLAHKAAAEAEVVIDNIAGHRKIFQETLVPRCIWCSPEIAAVGLTEAQARQSGRRVRVGKFPFMNSGKAHAVGATEGLIKIVACEESGEILGVHMIGENVTELLAQPLLAMTMEAAVEDLAQVLMPHPTLSESIKEAALNWSGLAVHLPKNKG